jgi:antirestriction protein
MNNNLAKPAVYVGTYGKYNNGSISGKWLYIEDYQDCDSFLKACRELHQDENDPELMFQDFENFPKAFYSESGITQDLWEYLDLDEDDREMLEAYQNSIDGQATVHDIDKIRDCYHGKWDSELDYTHEYLESTGYLSEIPENLQYYFNYEAFCEDLFMELTFHENHVFSN